MYGRGRERENTKQIREKFREGNNKKGKVRHGAELNSYIRQKTQNAMCEVSEKDNMSKRTHK